MRALVVSDIHSNLEALTAVLDDAGSFDVLWCLGDIVGYGPDPNACIDLIRSFEHTAIPGNHDWGSWGNWISPTLTATPVRPTSGPGSSSHLMPDSISKASPRRKFSRISPWHTAARAIRSGSTFSMPAPQP